MELIDFTLSKVNGEPLGNEYGKFLLFFCLLHVCNNQFENLKSLKIFSSAIFHFCPKKSPFKPKLACLEPDKTPKLCFTEIFGSQTVYYTYQANMYTSKVIQVSPLLPKTINKTYISKN